MSNFGIFKGFSDKLFEGELPTQLGKIGSESFGFNGLLDLFPNAAAAYSLRKLRTAYTGSAIRVRRSSDNTEQDIGFVNNSLDTSTLTSFCSGTNGFVKTWYDQSGNARDATQTTAANQPQIVSSGNVILLNSKPSVKFQDNTDLLRTTSSTGTFTTNTMAVVFKFNNLNSYGVIMSIGNTAGSCYTLSAQPSNQRSIYSGSPSVSSLNGTATQNQEIWGSTTATNSRKFWSNGVSQTITNENVSITSNLSDILIGNDTFGSTRLPDMQEAIYWDSTKTDTDLVAINTNQNSYYNVY